jgi:hypothetical protein
MTNSLPSSVVTQSLPLPVLISGSKAFFVESPLVTVIWPGLPGERIIAYLNGSISVAPMDGAHL